MSSSLFALHRCHVLNVVPFLFGVCFFAIEHESKIEIDNTDDEFLIAEEQVKNNIPKTYIWLSTNKESISPSSLNLCLQSILVLAILHTIPMSLLSIDRVILSDA